MTTMPFGVYVHVPFCASRCDYCAFATWTDRHHLMTAYVDAVVAEVRHAGDTGMGAATSVFFGGGTPSQLPGHELGRILDAIVVAPGAEVTVECNPDDVTAALLAVYREHGVNRISLGVQAMVPEVLETLGRRHDPAGVRDAVELVRAAGMASFNLDVIYGAAGESVEQWAATVAAVVDLGPPHVSAYGLTVEPGTPLADEPHRWPDDDDQADKYELTDDVLGAAGLTNYEISNWARPGHESRHNQLYWSQGDYRGFGCAAHSHAAGRRWWNVRTPERYIALVAAGESTEAASETLDLDTRRREGLQLALRTREGVPVDSLDPSGLGDLVQVRGERVVLTRRGRLLANEVSMRLE
jgi:putative oxygen-independent coproporphyrinogen III oxidase